MSNNIYMSNYKATTTLIRVLNGIFVTSLDKETESGSLMMLILEWSVEPFGIPNGGFSQDQLSKTKSSHSLIPYFSNAQCNLSLSLSPG